MMKRLAALSLVTAAVASPAAAQTNDAVSKAMFTQASGRYTPPKCSADKGKHFKVGSGTTYLKSAIEATPDKQQGLLNQAEGVVTDAIQTEGQDKAASAWYALGRIYLFQGDVGGADTALRRAEALAPDCKGDIDQLRRVAYGPVANDAAQRLKDGDTQGALAGFQLASSLYPNSAFAPYNVAAIYAQAGQQDSAAAYFAKAAASKGDSVEVKIARQAQYNLGVVQLNGGKPQDAVATFEKYVQDNPSDAEGKVALAKAYRAAGMTDKAKALDAQTGTTTATAPTVDGDLGTAVKLYNEKKYAEALPLFTKVLEGDPNNVTALSAQSNIYIANKDGAGLTRSASRLVELEPLNLEAQRWLQQGYRLTGDAAKANAAGEKRVSHPTGVTVNGFLLSPTGVQLTGTATGYEAMDIKSGKAVAAAPTTLTFEMLGKDGAVVTTQDVTIPALAKDAAHPFTVDAKGEGIAGYRYKVKS